MATKNRTETKTLPLAYKEAASYKAVRAHGVYGGITPRAEIFIAMFSERLPFPEAGHIDVFRDGRPSEEIDERMSGGVVREIEVGVTMDLATARNFRDWIDEKIQSLEGAIAAVNRAASEIQ